MDNLQITDKEIEERSIAALPTRPTAAAAFGGRGYTAHEMKEAFDLLPKLIAERFNALVAAAEATGEAGLASAIPTGLSEGHSLAKLFADVANGNFASYLTVHGYALSELIAELKSDVEKLKAINNV